MTHANQSLYNILKISQKINKILFTISPFDHFGEMKIKKSILKIKNQYELCKQK